MGTDKTRLFKTSDLIIRYLQAEMNSEMSDCSVVDFEDVDWIRFLQEIHFHRVFPLVSHYFSQNQGLVIPESVQKALDQSRNLNNKALLRLNFELSKIRKSLAESDVNALFYKGPTLAQAAYQSPYLRTFDDLDILVSVEDYLKPKSILEKHGYISPDFPTFSTKQADDFRHYAGEYSLVNPKGTVCLDIHSRLLGGGSIGFSKQFEHIWERAVEIECSAGLTLTLCQEDLLLYLCLNGLKDGWESLRTVCDVDRLVRNSKDMDWELILSEAKRLKLERAFRLALLISIAFLQTPIPSRISRFLHQDSVAESLKDKVCREIRCQIDEGKKVGPTRNFFLIFRALDNWSDRFDYIGGIPTRFYRLLTTINYRDSEIVRLPRLFHFLYYPIRILRVLLQYQFDIFKIIFK